MYYYSLATLTMEEDKPLLFKSLRAPNAAVSMDLSKNNFSLGECIEGTVNVTSQEDFEANEIRVELVAFEKLKPGGGLIRDSLENSETRLYSPLIQNAPASTSREYTMYRGQTKVSQRLAIPKNFNHQFSFNIQIPQSLGPTFQGMRKDGRWVRRVWNLKAVVAVGGRPDVDTTREVCVAILTPQATASVQENVVTTVPLSAGQGSQTIEAPVVTIQAQEPARDMITSCSKCGASINPNQEDLIVTCRYCGFTVTLAGANEIKNHSMIENHLFTQQAVEAAKKYMDKGILRSGVAREATITNVKLRYLPFWTFPVTTYTSYSGTTGAGLSGEMHQVQNAFSNKRASKLSKFGSLMKAGASAYLESQQKNRGPRTVSLSFSSSYVWPILARRSAIAEINYYDVPAVRKIPFDPGRIASDAEFLNTEFKQEEAKLRTKAEVEERERRVACGKVDALQSCNVTATIGDGELVHAPIWFVHYCLKGDNYMILVDGSEGKILGGGKPLFHV